jgi:primosomal protein N' (replication factor Y)
VGSGKCAIEYIASKHRFEILLRSSSGTSLRKAIRASMVELAVVDVDPIEIN